MAFPVETCDLHAAPQISFFYHPHKGGAQIGLHVTPVYST